jgi:hypothetical protein
MPDSDAERRRAYATERTPRARQLTDRTVIVGNSNGPRVAPLAPRSDVDHHVTLRQRAADQDISVRRWIERIRLVAPDPS